MPPIVWRLPRPPWDALYITRSVLVVQYHINCVHNSYTIEYKAVLSLPNARLACLAIVRRFIGYRALEHVLSMFGKVSGVCDGLCYQYCMS